MKNIILSLLLITVSLTLNAQKKDKNTGSAETATTTAVSQEKPMSKEYELQRSIALRALKYNDAVAAKNALFNMIALAPERVDLIDSLAMLYFQMGSYTECILVSMEILDRSPENNSILEIKAISEQSLGYAKDALEDYEKLYSASKNIYHLYQIASLQYDLARFGECDVTIQRLLQDEKLKETEIQIFLGQRQAQKVPMEAGIYNMQGMLLLNLNKEAEARAKFEAALKLDEEFVLPKNNIAALDKKNEKK